MDFLDNTGLLDVYTGGHVSPLTPAHQDVLLIEQERRE